MTEDPLDLILRALAHPDRRRLLATLRQTPDQSLFALCAARFNDSGQTMARQTVTQHLDQLEQAGLIATAWAGRTKLHRATPEPAVAAMVRLIENLS